MEQSKIDIFISTMRDKFLAEDIAKIEEELKNLPDTALSEIQRVEYKNPMVIFTFSVLFGGLGVDRFMLGQPILGILKLITMGGLGIWAIVDWFLVIKKTKKLNMEKFLKKVSELSNN